MQGFLEGVSSSGWLSDIGLKLLAFIVAAVIIRLARGPILSGLRRALRKTPPRVRAIMSRSVDQIYPSWRQRAGDSLAQTTLEWRISTVRASRRPQYFILGGVYLDLMVRPIKVQTLDNNEHSDLDQVRYECGGSACYVGHYLFEKFGEKSHLYTRLGEQSALSTELKRRLRDEPWVKRRPFMTIDSDAQSGISIHLKQQDESYRTTFTHKGALAGLSWNPVLKKLVKRTGRGGVLHIAGYFRTGLHADLQFALKQLAPNLIVSIDHGRFLPEDHGRAATALLEAFRAGLIDVYVCTLPELRRLMATAGASPSVAANTRSELAEYARAETLPRITVVRDNVNGMRTEANILLDGQLQKPVISRPGLSPSMDMPGKNNAFNAALIHHLVNGQPEEPLPAAVRNAVKKALKYWIQVAQPLRRNGGSHGASDTVL